jgi:hypothetical protein
VCVIKFLGRGDGVLGRRFAGAERGSRFSQGPLDPRCERVRAAEYLPRNTCHLNERRHGLAEIVERGGGGAVERLRKTKHGPPGGQRVCTMSQSGSEKDEPQSGSPVNDENDEHGEEINERDAEIARLRAENERLRAADRASPPPAPSTSPYRTDPRVFDGRSHDASMPPPPMYAAPGYYVAPPGDPNHYRAPNYGAAPQHAHYYAAPGWKSTSVSGAPDNSSLSHFSAMARPCWLGRAARNRHRHAIEQASRRWREGRRNDSARTRREI